MAQLMTLPLTVSCFSKIQIGFSFLVPAYLGGPGQRAIKRVCVLWVPCDMQAWQLCNQWSCHFSQTWPYVTADVNVHQIFPHFYCFSCGPSVLLHCQLGIKKSIRPVKVEQWGVGVVICLQRGADCLNMVQLMPLRPQTPSPVASVKSRLVLPFWYRLTQVVLEKRPLNGCSSSSSSSCGLRW